MQALMELGTQTKLLVTKLLRSTLRILSTLTHRIQTLLSCQRFRKLVAFGSLDIPKIHLKTIPLRKDRRIQSQ